VERRVDWPGRGPTWLGVQAIVIAGGGALILLDVLERQLLGHEPPVLVRSSAVLAQYPMGPM